MSEIPARARGLVLVRDRYLCIRCGTRGSDVHHRRRRAVRDDHTHCPCNLILLCRNCHSWVHHEVWLARADGLIVSHVIAEPTTKLTATIAGPVRFDCDGGFEFHVKQRGPYASD